MAAVEGIAAVAVDCSGSLKELLVPAVGGRGGGGGGAGRGAGAGLFGQLVSMRDEEVLHTVHGHI